MGKPVNIDNQTLDVMTKVEEGWRNNAFNQVTTTN